MIKLNDTASASINVLGEDELTQVVGGYCHRRRGGYGHCGGWRRREYKNDYGHCGGYEKKSDSYEGDSYEGGDDNYDSYEGDSSSGNAQVTNVNVTVNIAQVQG